MLLLPLSDTVIMKTLQSFSILHNIEPLYSSPSDREREKQTIHNKHQNTIDMQDYQAVTRV